MRRGTRCKLGGDFPPPLFKLGGNEDPVRIAANIVSGVGFLGAGVILRDSGKIIGLTTASIVWLAAGVYYIRRRSGVS